MIGDDSRIICQTFRSKMTTFSINEDTVRHKQSEPELINCMDRVSVDRLTASTTYVSRIQATIGIDRTIFILIVISAFYVTLNMPYIISWFLFFVPMVQETLTVEQIHLRYAFVQICEIFHMLNFSINFLFYYLAVKYCNSLRQNSKNLKWRQLTEDRQ